MTFIEILTIYLAVGAPFGVHYFLKHRDKSELAALWFGSVRAALLWVFQAAVLLGKRAKFSNRTETDSSLEKSIENVSRNLQNAFAASVQNNSFFEFRETLERYVGLTLAVNNASADSAAPEHELELFRVAGRDKKDLQLAGEIWHRRNFLRLQTHQLRARRDFLQTLTNLDEKILPDALCLTVLLDDAEAEKILKNRQSEARQTVIEPTDTPENEIWKAHSATASFPARMKMTQTHD